MASWSRVQAGFDADDETVNFGTRIIAENNGSLYETHTVATIESLEKVEQKPSVLASLQHSKLCLAIDKSITVFNDETCDKVLCNISFPSTIACYCISKNGFFLFVVLTTGMLYCLHLSNGKVIFTKSVPDNQNNVMEIFLKDQGEETFIILVLNTGAIYRFSNICLKTLEMAFTSGDKSAIIDHTTNIQCSELFKGFTSPEFLNATVHASSEKFLIAMVGTNSMLTWPDEQYCNLSTFSFGYKKVKFLNYSSMLCLRTDNVLSVICSNTLLGLKICEGLVLDFTVIQHDDYCDILFLTECKHNRAMYILCHISYPDFEQKLEINVSVTAHLFEALHAPGNIFYVEGITTENKVVDAFRIKTISESIPEMRLARLLRKRQFDAAESFARRLGLSMESIYCSKAALFIEQLGPWAKSAPDSVNMDALIDVLDKILDVQYVTECCSKALISDYMQMKQIYLYARERIVRSIKKGNTGPNDRLYTNLSLINDTLHRLETFQMIQDVEVDTLLDDDAAMKEWIRFSQTNLLEEFMDHLHMSQLKSATLIWTRHLSDIMRHVSAQGVRDIFIALPEDTTPSCLWSWLIHFIPTLLSLLPDALDEIVSWGSRKLKYLEISHRTAWPQIGTDFANKLIKLLRFGDNQQSVYFHQEYKCQNSALKRFMYLLQAISDIQQLKDDYRLRVSLDTYVDSPIEAIHTLMDKIQLDEIVKFVNTFLKRYMLNNNLQNDTVLCAYVQRVIKDSNSWRVAEEAAWEKRVATIVGLICDRGNQLEQILAVLRKAPVPWSSTIATLAEKGSNFDHSLAFKIKIERDYVPIKLILKKYGCTTIDVSNRLISLVIKEIIKENRDSMVDDLDVLTTSDRQLRQDAFCRCINVRLKEGNVQRALDIIQHLENDTTDALDCYEGIVNFIVAAISFRNATSLAYHIEILGCLEFKIQNLLTRSSVCSFRCNDIIDTIKDLKSLHALKREYKIDVSLKDYRMQKSLILHNCITELLPDVNEDNLSIMHKKIVRIAELLGLERSHATLSFVERTGNMSVLQQLVCDGDQNLNMMSNIPRFKDTNKICLSVLQHAITNTSVVEALKNLSASTLSTCKDGDLQSALTLYTCISACPSLSIQQCSDVKPGDVPQSWKLYTIYKDQTISPDQLLSLYKDVISPYLHHSDRISDNDVASCNEEVSKPLNNFLERTKKMQLQHNDYSLLQIFKTFYFMYRNRSVRDEATLTEVNSMLSQLLTNLLRKLCTGRSFDLHLGLSCLFMLSEQEACNWLSTACVSFQTDYTRHSIVSTLGYEYSRLTKNRSLMQTFEGYKLLHIWAQRLSHYSVAYKEVLINNASSKREILQQIVSSNKKNVMPLLKDYCCGFGFNFNDCLLLYLQTLLKTWKPTITVLDTNGSKELTISNDEVNELREKCDAIIAELEDKSMLKRSILTLWDQITFYHYEVFLILMDLVGDKGAEKRDYLCFLQNYTRNGPPTPMELDEWIHLNPGHGSLPPIAQWRLPFLLNVDIWKIITPELNLRTYDKWLDIASVLKLQTHLVCTLAIKGEMTRAWENNSVESKNAWSLYPKNTTLLKDIKECIQRITDSDGFYYGTAALYYVVNHTPSGADRVAAAKECYEYAQKAAQNSIKFEEGMLEKIRSKYLRFTAEHILRTHGLERDSYLALIENPYKLVYELYNDGGIPSRYRIATNYRPDINAAVNELGALFSLNVIKLRLDLLQEWLQPNVKYTELYQSFTETLPALKEPDQYMDHEDNLLRACYMLEYGDTDLFAQFLVNIGFGHRHGETEYNYNVRYRALRVLQTIVDTATLEELTKQDICTFRRYTKSLQYVSKLESLGLYYSVDAFETCSKRELVQILWKSQRHLPCALSVIAQICIEFEVHDIFLWDGTLSQMTKLRMVNELKKILLQVRSESVIVNCNGYKLGWQLIVSEPFREMDVNLSEEQLNNCVEAICLLYSCPMAHELDFTVIIRHCFQCKQAYLAAALLPFLNESERKFVLETINQTCRITELVENLNHLSSKGVLTVARSIAIVQKSASQR
ncbi:kinetochore-associated protein 1 isoform X1 [Ooceraea biroi]|uniref:kinetochore-associated protein 1 isoform X1 n=2 Tax=Ooceraea biroi TaxID=2015173 RepID=UPI000F096866|nr:kinetochore-associated protein 1 isoform X1 [Ooceraea biroi]